MSDNPDRIGKKEYERIFQEKAFPKAHIERYTSQEHPKAIVLAGQSGAGKGGLKNAAVLEFNDDIFVVDPGEQRESHPEAKRWQQESPYGCSQKTNSDAGAWAGELRSATRMIEGLQKAGYEAEIRAETANKTSAMA
jgi:hypothetical protein